jgi:hypothetical protein
MEIMQADPRSWSRRFLLRYDFEAWLQCRQCGRPVRKKCKLGQKREYVGPMSDDDDRLTSRVRESISCACPILLYVVRGGSRNAIKQSHFEISSMSRLAAS